MEFYDSAALGFLQSQLTHIIPQVYERKYAPIVYQDLVPVTNEASEWAESITTHYMDGYTEGKFVGPVSDDIPFTRIDASRGTIPVRYGGIGFEYSVDELRISQALNRDLSVLAAMQARRGYEEHAQRIAFFGDADRGLEGLFNHTEVATGGAASTFALAADGDAAAAILNEAIDAIIEDTKEIEIPNRVILPTSAFNFLATTRLDTTVSAMTILEYVRAHNNSTGRTNQPLDIRSSPHLEASGKMVVYSSSEEVMAFHIPLELRFLPPQPYNLKFRVPGEYKIAGLEMRYPGALVYRTGVI